MSIKQLTAQSVLMLVCLGLTLDLVAKGQSRPGTTSDNRVVNVGEQTKKDADPSNGGGAGEVPLKVQRPFLWKVEAPKGSKKDNVPSYLFGTIHVPDKEVTTLHPAAQTAFDQAGAAYFEIDFLKSSAQQMESIALPADQKLEDLISVELLGRLDARLAKISPLANRSALPNAHVAVWPLLLGNLDAQLRKLGELPLDMLLYTTAFQEEKEVGGLEKADGQLVGITQLPLEDQIAYLTATLDGMDADDAAGVDRLKELMQVYAAGDEKTLGEFIDHEFARIQLDKSIADRITKSLLGDRNQKMADAAHELITASPKKSFFFAVGVGHLVGKETVQEFLLKKGYQIERVSDEAADDAAK